MQNKQRPDYHLRQQCTAKDLEAICYFNRIIKNYKRMLFLEKSSNIAKNNKSIGLTT